MKKILFLAMLVSSVSYAETITKWKVGDRDYYMDSDGNTTTGYNIGSFRYLNDSNGNSAVINKIGEFEYINVYPKTTLDKEDRYRDLKQYEDFKNVIKSDRDD